MTNTTTTTGTCYYCNRDGFKLDGAGRLSRHGFSRPRWWGGETASCPGTKRTPEQSRLRAIEDAQALLVEVSDLLAGDLIEFTLARFRMETRKRDESGRRAWRKNGLHHWDREPRAEAFRALRRGETGDTKGDRRKLEGLKAQTEARLAQLG